MRYEVRAAFHIDGDDDTEAVTDASHIAQVLLAASYGVVRIEVQPLEGPNENVVYEREVWPRDILAEHDDQS